MTVLDKSCLGIVTARGGSKGVSNKNVRNIGGKPLIHYAIGVGLACPYIGKVMVTTDSHEIAEFARDGGAEVPFIRPADMATDTARQEDAILHAMDWYESIGETYDLVCLLQPTEPFRRVETLNRGFELLAGSPDATGVMSVALARSAPSSVNTLRADGTLREFIDPRFRFANRQDRPLYYELSAVVAISRWSALRRLKSFCQDTALSLVVDPVEAIDIDDPIDFVLAEALANMNLTNSLDVECYVKLNDRVSTK